MSYQIGFYNGWSGEERLAALPILRAALEAGTLDPPTRCSMCLVTGSPDWRAADGIVFHDEDYSNPLAAYTVCKPCHRLIHMRFWSAADWIALVARHARDGAWFERLSMDPDSRTRPFVQTYPDGLPSAFHP